MKEKIKLGDIVVISLVFIAALTLFFCFSVPKKEDAGTLSVSVGTQKTQYPLDKDDEFEIESGSYTLKIEVKNGSVRVKSSDCPDKTCVHSGRISKKGQLIACVPARVILEIEGKEDGYDFVAG